MKIKQKLALGMGLLFGMIVLLAAIAGFYISRLSNDTKNILVANYNSLDYCREMLQSVNKNNLDSTDIARFETNLAKQQANITEPGEQQLTEQLAADFLKLKNKQSDTATAAEVHNRLTDIMLLNMQAIERKSSTAQKTADAATLWIALAGTICFLIAFVMLVNLPGNIANPLKELTGSIKEIAAQNYSSRVHFEKQDEFGELAGAFNTMAQKLEEYQASSLDKLLMEKKRIETLINNISNPVIGLDARNHILFINEVAVKITGLNAAGVIGKPVQNIALTNDLIRLLVKDLFEPGPATGAVQELIKIYADNKESYFQKQVVPIKIIPTGETEEKLAGNVILLQNITPFKELDFAKTNFIATISHELKTPIAAIKMSLQLLENKQTGPVNEEQQSLINSIKDDTGRLLKITGELLNMTQVESGVIQMAVTPTPVKDIIEDAVQANHAAAAQKQVRLEIKLPHDIPSVLADSEKTTWVLTNLISNAIRYSHDNATVTISVNRQNQQLAFAVTDSGQGIAPEYKDKIFNRYFRIPGNKKEGTGLGLSISKEFIEAQGGSIAVVSDLGTGSTFSFVLNAAG